MTLHRSAVDMGSANGSHHESEYQQAKAHSDAAVQVPVLIVGGGPAGLLQAHLLSKLGVKCLIVERYAERLGAPKAHALCPRSLEICHQFGLNANDIRKLGTKRSDAYWVNFLTDLNGQTIGTLPYERMDPAVLEDTPEMIHNIPQPMFEQFVADALAQSPNVEIRKGVSFVSLTQVHQEVVTIVEERATGHQYQIRSKYVVACDGARSKVRSHLRIESDGEDSYETMMTIHFNANLRPIVGDRVGMLHWIADPAASGFIIAYDLSGNAVLISNFDSDKHPVDSWNEELCRRTVTAALGVDVPFQVLSYRPWILNRKVARSYRVGNVFLAGDAAHSFPPTGGLGLNSGLADVHNLAYKLAYVLQGHAADALLDTYETERRHIAMVNSVQSVKNGKKIFELLKTLGIGTDPDVARKQLRIRLNDPSRRAAIDDGIEAQREHFDNLELHIGYVYGDETYPSHASKFSAKFVPGARLPHAWIRLKQGVRVAHDVSYVSEFDAHDCEQRQFSTLDLCHPAEFVLIGSLDVPGITSYRLGVNFDVIGSLGHQWALKSGISQGGTLLVRPDQHILQVFAADATAESVRDVIDKHLGLSR